MSEIDDLASEQISTHTEQVPSSPVSDMLVNARQAKKLSQQEVADRLFLTVNYIKYIDEGLFEKIPKQAFTRGYLRSYARVVGVDGDEVVNCFEETGSKTDLEPGSLRNVTEEEVGPTKFTGPVAQTGLVGLAGVALVIFLVWWLTPPEEEMSVDSIETTEQFEASTIEPAPQSTIESIPVEMVDSFAAGADQTGQVDRQESGSLSVADGSTDTSQQNTIDDVLPEQPQQPAIEAEETPLSDRQDEDQSIHLASEDGQDETSVQPESEPAELGIDHEAVSDELELAREVTVERFQEGEYSIIRVHANGEDHLRFTFIDECWLEVTDAQDDVYADLNHAGDVVDIYGKTPFNILIGRAQAVTLLYNDQPFSLVPHISNDTAKLVVGN